MAARQLPCRTRACARSASEPPARLLPRAARARERTADRIPARLRARHHADLAHRRAHRSRQRRSLPHRLSGAYGADDRRALGHSRDAAARSAGEHPPHGAPQRATARGAPDRGPRVRALPSGFVPLFLHQLRAAPGAFPPLAWLEQWITGRLSPERATARVTDRLGLPKLGMANSITSLRGITQRDWRKFVEGQSVMERVLREDPAACYSGMTFATRDEYRHVVERLANGTRQDEAAGARG